MSSSSPPPIALNPQQVKESIRSLNESRSIQQRVASLASPILIANEDLCEERTVYSLGLEWVTINDLPIGFRDVGLVPLYGDIPSILYVVAGSSAEKAGLRLGDLLLAVNDMSIEADSVQMQQDRPLGRVRPYRRKLTETIAHASEEGRLVRLSYRRKGVDNVVELHPQEQCGVQVLVVEDTSMALYSKGGTIYLSKGLYEFAKSDAELQALIAHQLAHFIAGHGTKSGLGTTIGGVVGGVAALGAIGTIAIANVFLSEQGAEGEIAKASAVLLVAGVAAGSGVGSWFTNAALEREADNLSAHLLARAGVDIENALQIWNRLPSKSEIARKHRLSNARFENIAKAIEEVKARRNSMKPLVPNPNSKVLKSKDRN